MSNNVREVIGLGEAIEVLHQKHRAEIARLDHLLAEARHERDELKAWCDRLRSASVALLGHILAYHGGVEGEELAPSVGATEHAAVIADIRAALAGEIRK